MVNGLNSNGPGLIKGENQRPFLRSCIYNLLTYLLIYLTPFVEFGNGSNRISRR